MDEQYFIKVHFSIFKSAWVEYIDWDDMMIYYTKDFYQAGYFEPYERACEVAEFLETQKGIAWAEVVCK